MQHKWKMSLADKENYEKVFLKMWEKWYVLGNIKHIAGKDYIVMDNKEFYHACREGRL